MSSMLKSHGSAILMDYVFKESDEELMSSVWIGLLGFGKEEAINIMPFIVSLLPLK